MTDHQNLKRFQNLLMAGSGHYLGPRSLNQEFERLYRNLNNKFNINNYQKKKNMLNTLEISYNLKKAPVNENQYARDVRTNKVLRELSTEQFNDKDYQNLQRFSSLLMGGSGNPAAVFPQTRSSNQEFKRLYRKLIHRFHIQNYQQKKNMFNALKRDYHLTGPKPKKTSLFKRVFH